MKRFVVTLVAVSLVVGSAVAAFAAWNVVVLDNFGDANGETTSLALDANGRAFIAYTAGGDDLFWAKKTAAGWKKTQVAGKSSFVACYDPDVDWNGPAATFRPSGDPVIASACLAVGGGSPVKFSRFANGVWTTSVIGSTPSGTGDASATSVDLALNQKGKPSIVVASRIGTIVRFRQIAGVWKRQVLVKGSGICCQTPTISVSFEPSSGDLGVAWNNSAYGGAVSYAAFDADGRRVGNIQGIPIADAAYGRPSLTFLDGDPIVAFQEGTDTARSGLLARRTAGIWSIIGTIDDGSAITGGNPDLAIANGVLHVAFHDETNGDLRYGTSADGTTWSTQAVITDGDLGDFPSLGVTDTGGVRISFHDTANTALKYVSGP